MRQLPSSYSPHVPRSSPFTDTKACVPLPAIARPVSVANKQAEAHCRQLTQRADKEHAPATLALKSLPSSTLALCTCWQL